MNRNAMLKEKQRTALNQFRSAVSDILKPHHDDEYLLRWLKARDFDAAKAEKMIRKSFKVMHNLDAENILNSNYAIPKVVEEYLPTRLWGCDKEGSPVRFLFAGKLDFRGFYRSSTVFDMMKLGLYLMEYDLRAARKNSEKTGKFNPKTVFVLDYQDFDFRQMLDRIVITHGITVLTAYQDNFPELLKTAYLINVLSVFKPFVDENTWKRIRVFGPDGWKDELQETIGRGIIPKYYGGDLDDPHYDPDVFLATMGNIPTTYYVKDQFFLKMEDPGTIEAVIQEYHAYNHTIKVQKTGTILKWVFQTKDFNIKFGVLFQTSQDVENKGSFKEIVKSEFVDSHHIPERGELRCEKIGEYILQFDNTHSWFRKKYLRLRVDIEEPVDELASSY